MALYYFISGPKCVPDKSLPFRALHCLRTVNPARWAWAEELPALWAFENFEPETWNLERRARRLGSFGKNLEGRDLRVPDRFRAKNGKISAV
jgi:hypothetical protein